MRIIMVFLAVLSIGLLPAVAQEKADLEHDKKLIEEASMNYIEGWYEGSVERMDKALHPDLTKRFMRYAKDGMAVTNSVTKDDMLNYTRMGGGTKSPNKDKENIFTILDISGTIASVKCVSGDYIDYMQMVKVNDQWKILNVLWRPVPRKKAEKK